MEANLQTDAILLSAPRQIGVQQVGITPPGRSDVVVEIAHSGISSGTEKLFWTGDMPPFPGMGYPLVPGYEAVGEVVEAGADSGLKCGDRVFVPGANCFTASPDSPVFALFGGAARRLVSDASRVVQVDAGLGAEGALLALAATAHHAIAGSQGRFAGLIVGHGALGRLLARITMALGGPAPTVWETNPARMGGATGYTVCPPDAAPQTRFDLIIDASGADGQLDRLIPHLAPGGELVLAGFYTQPLSFAFVPAFLREARLRVAAEWQPADLHATRALLDRGALSLAGLITHRTAPAQAEAAYQRAFTDPDCLKMIIDWESAA